MVWIQCKYYKRVRPSMLCLFFLSSAVLVAGSISIGRAQSTVPVANAVVTADVLVVYREMRLSSEAVQTLKKGAPVVLDFEIKTTESWCRIKLPGQTAHLGYVQCQGLERMSQSTPVSPAGSGGAKSPQPGRPANALAVAPPAVTLNDGYQQIVKAVVREDFIDVQKMGEFDDAAQGGSVSAMARAAVAHLGAGLFELSRDSDDEAIEQFQSSLKFAGKSPELQLADLLNLAYVDLVRSEYSSAQEYLERARVLSPHSVFVARLLGWTYYDLNQIDKAVGEWQMAQRIQPDPRVAQALEKAQRDEAAESDAHESNSSRFILRYQGGAASPELAAEILSALEVDFRDIQDELRFTPAEPIGVVLYTGQSFRDTIRSPDWAVAGNDGRIRLPVEGLTSVSDELSRVLKHELTHSFVRQMTLGRCPQWLDEGLAQWMEGKRSGSEAKALVASYEERKYIPLKNLEGEWGSLPTPAAAFAYAWSLAAVEYMVSESGMFGVQRLFGRFDSDPSFEAALSASFQVKYVELESQTVDYLRQTYP